MPPRRQAAPRGESRTGLIVALVFFILTTITLGVVAYMGYDGQKVLEESAKKSADDAKLALEAEREKGARLLAYQILTGTVPIEKAQELGIGNGNEKFRNEVTNILTYFKPFGLDWDEKSAAPTTSMLAVMKDLTEKTRVADENARKYALNTEQAIKDYGDKSATAVRAQETAQKEAKNAHDTTVVAQKETQDAKSTAVNELNNLKEKNKELQQRADTTEEGLRRDLKKLQEEIVVARDVLEKQRREQDARRAQMLLTDKVVGRVTKVDGVAGTAYINLGSADYVRPGMTFSILTKYDASRYGVEDRLPKKATLVVNQVVTDHMSRTSIEFDPAVNAIQDPVEVGDGLYKPGWKPGTPVRWALVGHFDLNGLGRDETLLLKSRLEKEGIIVDAYLDLNSLKVVGDLNHGIDYLVVGNRPTGETARVIGEGRKKAIEDAMKSMIDSARDMSITVMQGRVFLPMFGIDLPRHQALPFFPGGAGGAPPGESSDKQPEKQPEKEGK